jgi:hypothetical protein
VWITSKHATYKHHEGAVLTCLFLRVIETLLRILHLTISIGMNRCEAGLAFEDLSRHPEFIIFVRSMCFPAAWC